MDGAPISHDHGGPVRLYVAPMYFYKSIKWLDRITVSDEVVPGYWEVRGYDVDAWVGQSNGRIRCPHRLTGSAGSPGLSAGSTSPSAALMGVCIVTAAMLYWGPLSTLVGRRDAGRDRALRQPG